MSEAGNYFNAEKFESLFFILIGIIAIITGIYFWVSIKEPFYKGIAIPLFLIALIQLTVGIAVYLRSPKDIIKVEHFLRSEPSKIQSDEIPRMEVVMKNFVVYRYVEIALIIIGLMLFFTLPDSYFWKGLGFGLSIQAGIMLLLDFFAENRGQSYLEFLKSV